MVWFVIDYNIMLWYNILNTSCLINKKVTIVTNRAYKKPVKNHLSFFYLSITTIKTNHDNITI